MRMSCNGCRVLRKGCTDSCTIKPCLQWIKTPEAQANATLFLAKFYGRAGLLNLIDAAPPHLRPAVFRSLLYEASGRILNPIYGPVGLLWSGSWQLCQAAVDCVLNGSPITPINSEAAETPQGPPLKTCDIRHVSKDLHKVKSRCRFKRSDSKQAVVNKIDRRPEPEKNRSASHDSTVSHPAQPVWHFEEPSRDSESVLSGETDAAVAGFDLELSLGI
uniref:LOB domain-containing protein n=1 Tax=Kalanchoe fedtschenkoi TaxID=63787 RepID=A0A7N0T8J6_KALFE